MADMAELLGMPEGRVRYLLRKHEIQPAGQPSGLRVWNELGLMAVREIVQDHELRRKMDASSQVQFKRDIWTLRCAVKPDTIEADALERIEIRLARQHNRIRALEDEIR